MEWISVKDRLPEAEGQYLCVETLGMVSDTQHILTAFYSSNLESVGSKWITNSLFKGRNHPGWWNCDLSRGYYEELFITHWMPLPELPKKGSIGDNV